MSTIRYGLIFLVLGAGTAQAQDGFFDFSQIPGVGGEPHVQIDLNPAMLGFVAAAASAGGEPNAAELLAGIERIRVRVYEELEDPDQVVEFIDDTSGQLERDGWERAVYIQDGSERVRIYLRIDDTRIQGMTVMVADGSEAVFINIAGAIDPTTLGRVAGTLGLNGVMGALDGGLSGLATGPAATGQGADADAQ